MPRKTSQSSNKCDRPRLVREKGMRGVGFGSKPAGTAPLHNRRIAAIRGAKMVNRSHTCLMIPWNMIAVLWYTRDMTWNKYILP
jgi:hypothetical protein